MFKKVGEGIGCGVGASPTASFSTKLPSLTAHTSLCYLLLMEKDLLSEKEAWHLVRLIRLRNRIAHEYHTFSDRDLEDLIEGLDALEALQPL